jgi:hypothetical protein
MKKHLFTLLALITLSSCSNSEKYQIVIEGESLVILNSQTGVYYSSKFEFIPGRSGIYVYKTDLINGTYTRYVLKETEKEQSNERK